MFLVKGEGAEPPKGGKVYILLILLYTTTIITTATITPTDTIPHGQWSYLQAAV